ncbi:acyltransferase family protein [Kineococcus sp. SYSU DK002]|uniref:acyltransferase family protein n=1 Tax=Kineococcus sp. SYSU DK002 TaxID=3383123 RepID=UPI003D7E12D6
MTPTGARSRLDWVDTARGASILLVVMYHAGLFAASVGLTSNPWNLVNGAAQVLRMPLFFFLSGLLATRAVERPWRILLRGRIGTNLYLYVLWASAAFLLFTLIPYGREGAPRGPWHWVESTFLLPENGTWYLLTLALFIVTARLLRAVPTTALLGVAAVVSTVAGTGLVEDSFVWNNCLVLFVFFAAGVRLPSATLRTSTTLGRPRVALPLVVVVGGASLLAAHRGWMDVAGVRTLLGAAAVVTGIAVSVLIARTAAGRLLARLGRDTLAVYVTHEMLLAVLVLPLAGLAGSSWTDAARWAAPVILIVAGTAAAVALRGPLSQVPWVLRTPGRSTVPTSSTSTPASAVVDA